MFLKLFAISVCGLGINSPCLIRTHVMTSYPHMPNNFLKLALGEPITLAIKNHQEKYQNRKENSSWWPTAKQIR